MASNEDTDAGLEPRRPRWRARWGRRRMALGLAVILVGAGVALPWATGSGTPAEPTMTMGSSRSIDRFAELASQHSNYCSLDPATVMSYPDDRHLEGSCCNPMDRDHYDQQVEGLRRWADIPEIPQDPYDIEARLAKELLGYDETITLDTADQANFDRAMDMTTDGGPCCCQCWRWYMTEGLAKFLITRHDMPADEIAEITDVTNGCGGPGETADGS